MFPFPKTLNPLSDARPSGRVGTLQIPISKDPCDIVDPTPTPSPCVARLSREDRIECEVAECEEARDWCTHMLQEHPWRKPLQNCKGKGQPVIIPILCKKGGKD